MKKVILTAAMLTAIATPAHAQLLGNGSLTGGLGSALDINGTISRTNDTLRSTTRGAVEGSARTEGSQSVDRNSGRVEARRSADIAGAANVTQLITTPIAPAPIAPAGASASGSGSASGNGEAQAQLIGTDAVGNVVGSAAGQARSTAGTAVGTAVNTGAGTVGTGANLAGSAAGSAITQAQGVGGSLPNSIPAFGGSASGNGSASGEGSAQLISTPLAVAGSAAGAAQGATTISPGMPVVTPEGLPVGEVRQIVADSRGQVQQVIVSNGNVEQAIPAADLAASGGALIAGEAVTEGNLNAPQTGQEGA